MTQFNQRSGGGKGPKPPKPRPDFPLYAHAVGKWAKTIRGQTYYFGTWADPERALREYLDQKDDLYAGRTPGGKGGPTIRDLANAFIRSKRIDLVAGRLSPRTFSGYDAACRRLIDHFGANRLVASLGPADFEELYARLSRQHGIATLGREITVTRGVFKYGWESDLIEKPVKFGPKFRGPTKQDRRKANAKAERQNGKRLFSAEEIRRLLQAADPQLRAMILLAINGGLGNTDLADLTLSALDLKQGWLSYPRPKPGVDRRVPLWPETVAALQEAIAGRRRPHDPADANVVFVTKYGQRWVRFELNERRDRGKRTLRPQHCNALGNAFAKLLEETGLRRPGLTFYRLRHTFETVAGGSKDQVAVDAIMGHVDPSMAATYRHGLEDARLLAVVEHVRGWLFGKSPEVPFLVKRTTV